MSVEAIRLVNFRGFRDCGIELRPLTVLLGPNSSGKSSFGHALAAMSHAHWLHQASGERLTLTPSSEQADQWPIDLGTLVDLRTAGASGPVEVGLKTREGWVDYGFGIDGFLRDDLRLSLLRHPTGMDMISAGTAQARVERPTVLENATTDVPTDGLALGPNADARIEIRRVNEVDWKDSEQAVRVGFRGLLLETLSHVSLTQVQVSGTASDDVGTMLESLVYLRATRKRPARGYSPRTGVQKQRLGYAGEWTTSVLHEEGGNPVRWMEPPLSPNARPDEVAEKLNQPWTETNASLLQGVGHWLEHLRLARVATVTERDDRQLQLTVRPTASSKIRDITEVGFGISQVLPVLVAGLNLPNNGTLIVDLPEAHLHPAPQALLADFFCSLALAGRRVLIETHSEALFERLRVLAETSPAVRAATQVYFLDEPKDGLCCPPHEVGLAFEDELDWPEGFMLESWATETLLRAAREARRRTKV